MSFNRGCIVQVPLVQDQELFSKDFINFFPQGQNGIFKGGGRCQELSVRIAHSLANPKYEEAEGGDLACGEVAWASLGLSCIPERQLSARGFAYSLRFWAFAFQGNGGTSWCVFIDSDNMLLASLMVLSRVKRRLCI